MCDHDNSGGCTRDEMNNLLDMMGAPEDVKQTFNNYFDHVDVDGSGEIEVGELRAAMGGLAQRGSHTKHYHLSQVKDGPPSSEDILDGCQQDNADSCTRGELHDFLDDKGAPSEVMAVFHDMFDEKDIGTDDQVTLDDVKDVMHTFEDEDHEDLAQRKW